MKNIFYIAILAFISFLVTSCEKDEGKLPAISFKTGGIYTAADKTIAVGDSVVLGINASKSEEKDYLKTFTISKAIGAGSATEIYNEALSGATGDTYTHDITVHGITAQTEKYTFTVVNKDGLTNAVSLTLTVQ